MVILDRRGPGEMTSFGNLGGIQNLATLPIAMPGMLKDVPRWLTEPDAPLHVRPSYAAKAAPWLYRFWRQSTPERAIRNAKALDALNRNSVDCHRDLAKWAGLEHLLHIPGQFYLWTDRTYYDRSTFSRSLLDATGQSFREVSAAEIHEREPALSKAFEIGPEIPGNGYCSDPYALTKGLLAKATSEGATYVNADVSRLHHDGGTITGIETDRGIIKPSAVVLAAGMWSRHLAESLGFRIPLESHRGYHVTIPEARIQLSTMCLVIDRKVAITPMSQGLRIGGMVEFAGLDAMPDYRRAQQFLKLGRELIPGLATAAHTEWMGHRPCLPDSLPVIGRTASHRNLYCAFGHGHMGLIGSAPTARIIADQIANRPAGIDLAPYAIERFASGAH